MRCVLPAVASGAGVGEVRTVEDEASADEVRHAYEELNKAAPVTCKPQLPGARIGAVIGGQPSPREVTT